MAVDKRRRRGDRLIQEEIHDTYQERRKPPEGTRCPECGVVFLDGRWAWAETPPKQGPEELCPACRRIRDKYPEGFVTIGGSFLKRHREEIGNLVQNEAKAESAEHPLNRIMEVKEEGDGILVTTTDSHLARRIGDALFHAYEGDLEYEYTEGDTTLRVSWRRDD